MIQKVPFLEALDKKILLFDGAMGTEIQKFNPKPEDFPDNNDGFNDGLVLTRPEWIKKIHRSYLEVGADCIETNSFGSNKIKLDEYGFGEKTVDFNKKIVTLAIDVASEFSDKPRYVIGSMGPTGYLISSNDPDLGQKPLNEIREAFEEYQRTQFGGWPWPKHEQAHERNKGRFALHADGKEELK